MPARAIDDDVAWESFRREWTLRPGTIYLNHGSFGPPPNQVIHHQKVWKAQADSQPMDFFVRQYAPAWRASRQRLADWIRASASDLVFVENATHGMNVVANSFPLRTGDEVMLTDHEYGAVERIWQRRCAQVGAVMRTVKLPQPIESVEQVVATCLDEVTARTRLLVVSHITSPTAIILPVKQLCAAAREQGVATCIDGPHAPAQVDINFREIGCDFYTASCHKWLSAPFGSGFLYVASGWQSAIATPQLSWGLLRPDKPKQWDEEFIWCGTRDASPYLTIPVAIDFLEQVDLNAFRQRTHWLARYARNRLAELAPRAPLVPDSNEWYGSMAHMPLPALDTERLQRELWEKHSIEVPIVDWSGCQWIRVSCHLYNNTAEIDRLVDALRDLI